MVQYQKHSPLDICPLDHHPLGFNPNDGVQRMVSLGWLASLTTFWVRTQKMVIQRTVYLVLYNYHRTPHDPSH